MHTVLSVARSALHDSGAFSLVEVLVAIVILATGLLGFVTTSAWSVRAVHTGWRFTEAAALAEGELAVFQAGACDRAGQGERVRGPFGLHWVAGEPSFGHQFVVVVVSSRTPRGERADTFSTVLPC